MDRFDKFTDRARKVLTLAQDEAQRFNHNYIGTEHLLLGLVREGEGVAARVLENMNVELAKVRTAVEFIIGRGDRPVVGRGRADAPRETGHRARDRRGPPAGPQLHRHRAPAPGPRARGRGHRGGRAREPRREPGQGPPRGHPRPVPVVVGRPGAGDEARQQDPDRRRARHQPHRGRPGRQARPGHRPREGDRAGHPDPGPQDQEQPGPDRRARRRQDGDRRGPRAPDRRRRRARTSCSTSGC